jgi:hypothetical protein
MLFAQGPQQGRKHAESEEGGDADADASPGAERG